MRVIVHAPVALDSSVLSEKNKFTKYEVLFYVCSPEGPNEVNSHDIVPCLSFWACFLNFVQNIEGNSTISILKIYRIYYHFVHTKKEAGC